MNVSVDSQINLLKREKGKKMSNIHIYVLNASQRKKKKTTTLPCGKLTFISLLLNSRVFCPSFFLNYFLKSLRIASFLRNSFRLLSISIQKRRAFCILWKRSLCLAVIRKALSKLLSDKNLLKIATSYLFIIFFHWINLYEKRN